MRPALKEFAVIVHHNMLTGTTAADVHAAMAAHYEGKQFVCESQQRKKRVDTFLFWSARSVKPLNDNDGSPGMSEFEPPHC